MEHHYLTSILSYVPDTGKFYWAKPRPKIKVGDEAGSLKKRRGYVSIELDGKEYAAHRLAWFYINAVWPKDQIDHINRIRHDNRIENLREATNSQNRANSKPCGVNGLKGIRKLPWMKEGDRCWQAQITFQKKNYYLGCFHTPDEAHEAYKKASIKFHKEFSNA